MVFRGGVLSPVLFNIYAHRTLITDSGVKCCAFADAVKLYTCVVSEADHQLMRDALATISQWSIKWGLPLSKEKTCVLHLGSRNAEFNYYLSGSCIGMIGEIKDLRFLVTKTLALTLTVR